MIRTIETHDEAGTLAFGRALAADFTIGLIVLLHGDLGAGKTALVRGMAEGLSVDPDDVSSPTFTLVQEYRGGRLTLYHVDLYRLSDREVPDLGLEELSQTGVLAVEWAEKWGRPAGKVVDVTIEDLGDTHRRFTIADGPAPG
jgi:tRNA threonylcarbamoyladenosine biosynthesis protein TsaE